MKVQLEASGYTWMPPDEDDAVRTIEALAARAIEEREFIEWVKHHTRKG